MEVDAVSFPHHLLGIIKAISEADFVSFDLELSGIPSRIPGKPRFNGRATLEERYLECKTGAERYQILQVGITCARFDYLLDKYVLRPYNINISPLLEERLDIEREVSFPTGAVTFLLSNGFEIDRPFTRGVQYLSRDEAKRAKQMAYDRIEKKNPVEDLHLKETDVDSLDFLRRVRQAIEQWMQSLNTSLDITTYTGLKNKSDIYAISRFEKRLVHQLVRSEFPNLVTLSKPDHIRIIDHDAEREAENVRRLKQRFHQQVGRQTGFRWVVEALAGGNKIDSLDPMTCARNAEGTVIAADLRNIKDRLQRSSERLKKKQPILVGHNMFTDIVYFYKTFIGDLPDTLDGFREALHQIFPRIVDTKYLATFDGGDLHASPTLQEISEGLENQRLPEIITHADHGKYHDTKAFHEAGYDSLLTATVMLRLATKLNVGKKAALVSDTSPKTLNIQSIAENSNPTLIDGREKIQDPVALPPIEPIQLVSTSSSGRTRATTASDKERRNKKTKYAGEFHHTGKNEGRKSVSGNMFAMLSISDEGASGHSSDDEHEGGAETASDGQKTSSSQSWQDEQIDDKSQRYAINSDHRDPMELLPSFDSPFWDDFGNRLRIFGTQETVLKVADWVKQ